MMEKEQTNADNNVDQAINEENAVPETNSDGQNGASGQEEEAIVALKQQLEEAKAKYLYLAADFENFKRHAARERVEMIQSAGKEIMTAMLPILDDFDRAHKNGGLTDGMVLIHQKLASTLRSKGLALIELSAGDAFNPDQQEAVTEIPVPSDDLKGKIVDILEPGYQLGERIIRFAKVVVGK